jgi:hypothetical protein
VNLIERWFKGLTDKRLRRGTFTSVVDLIAGSRPGRSTGETQRRSSGKPPLKTSSPKFGEDDQH